MNQPADSTHPGAGQKTLLGTIRAAARWSRRLGGTIYRRLRDSIDRRLHPRRRRVALARLERRAPQRVLMVCLGNICRSPYAEFALRRALPGHGFEIRSAGFIGPDRRSPERAQAAAQTLGIDLGPHRSRLITTQMLREHDLVVVMETGQRTQLLTNHRVPDAQILLLGDLDPEPIETRTIPDPYAGSLEDFTRCYERVQRCIEALAGALGGPRGDA